MASSRVSALLISRSSLRCSRVATAPHSFWLPTRPSNGSLPTLARASIYSRSFASRGAKPAKAKVSPASNSKNPFPLLPLLAILAVGSGAFYYLVQNRKEPIAAMEEKPRVTGPTEKPTFSPDEVSVVFVLGGPGAGKGTQCQNLVRDYGFVHLSAGDLLRAEQQREGSEFGELIKTYIREGKIVPMEVTIALLENAMRDAKLHEKKSKFLIDGFPRQMDQAVKFEEDVCPSKFTLFFDCSEEDMLKRLLKRGETSGREDDNIESIKKRFRTFKETSYPVIEYFEKQGKVVKITASASPTDVYVQVKEQLKDKLRPAMIAKK